MERWCAELSRPSKVLFTCKHPFRCPPLGTSVPNIRYKRAIATLPQTSEVAADSDGPIEKGVVNVVATASVTAYTLLGR